MTDLYDRREQERYQSYLNVYLKKDQSDIPLASQIKALEKQERSKWWHLLINIAAILFFSYWFYFDITQLGQPFFIIIAVVFGINVGLILYQKKQINELIDYLEWKQKQNE